MATLTGYRTRAAAPARKSRRQGQLVKNAAMTKRPSGRIKDRVFTPCYERPSYRDTGCGLPPTAEHNAGAPPTSRGHPLPSRSCLAQFSRPSIMLNKLNET